MFRAGGHVPVHTVAPASASALAMAKPYPSISASGAVVLAVAVAPQLNPRAVIGAQPPRAGVAGAERRRGRLTREAARLHRVHDPAAGERFDHVRLVARQ